MGVIFLTFLNGIVDDLLITMQHLFGVDFVARLFDYFSVNDGPKNDWIHSMNDIVNDFKDQSLETINTAIQTLLDHEMIVKMDDGFKLNLESETTWRMMKIANDLTMKMVTKVVNGEIK